MMVVVCSDKGDVLAKDQPPQFTTVPIVFSREVHVSTVDMDVADRTTGGFQINDLPNGAVDGIVRPQFLPSCSVISREIHRVIMNGESSRRIVSSGDLKVGGLPKRLVL